MALEPNATIYARDIARLSEADAWHMSGDELATWKFKHNECCGGK